MLSCQPETLDFALANPDFEQFDPQDSQRFLLSSGDTFYVPTGNIYRLENLSETHECKLFFIRLFPAVAVATSVAATCTSVAATSVAAGGDNDGSKLSNDNDKDGSKLGSGSGKDDEILASSLIPR